MPKSMIELCAGDSDRVERMLQVFAYLRLKYESQVLNKYVYDHTPSGLHDDDDPWPEYLELLMKCSRHKETLGAFNDTLPTEEFLSDWMNESQTLEALLREARGTTSPPSKGWMFENQTFVVREMCRRTNLDFPLWLTSIFDDGDYVKYLRDNEDRMKRVADALFHHRPDDAERMTPPNVLINWNVMEKDILDVNSA